MASKKTSDETTGGTIKDADIYRYSEESSGTFASKKHTHLALKNYMRAGLEAVYNEVPSLDVGRTVVTLANDYVPGSVRLFVEGVRLVPTADYTETDTDQLTLTRALPSGEPIVADYNKL